MLVLEPKILPARRLWRRALYIRTIGVGARARSCVGWLLRSGDADRVSYSDWETDSGAGGGGPRAARPVGAARSGPAAPASRHPRHPAGQYEYPVQLNVKQKSLTLSNCCWRTLLLLVLLVLDRQQC